MPSPALTAEYEQARRRYTAAVADLQPLLVRMALEILGDLLPGVHELEVDGRFNEDWVPTLRIQRILSQDGAVLFDIGVGHDDPRIEAAIDEVNTEYLDFLLDLTGDDYLGHRTIDELDIERREDS